MASIGAGPLWSSSEYAGRSIRGQQEHQQSMIEGSEKRLGLHIVGIAAEACVLPAGIDGIFPGLSQPAQASLVDIRDVRIFQMLSQRIRLKLRIVAGTR